MIVLLAQSADADPFAFEPHPEVWLLIAAVVGLGVYVARVIGPKVVPEGEKPVTGRQIGWFFTGVALLWLASDWPVHDIAENSLYTIHMAQHLVLTFLVPPAFWLATPEWLARLVIRDDRRSYAVLKRLGSPVVAGVIFNVVTLITHWPLVVNTSVRYAAVHYSLHVVIVSTAFLMWIPVCGPWKELRLSIPGQMIYLFLMSIVPTVPGAWLSLAETPVYEVYDHGPRLWGMSVIEDQATAGVFMKLGGGSFLWIVIIILFFRWAASQERESNKNRLIVDPVTMQPVGMGFPDKDDKHEAPAPADTPLPSGDRSTVSQT